MVLDLIYAIAALGIMAAGWFLLAPLLRSGKGKSLNDRMTDQVTRSAELLRECSSTMGAGTAFGRLSTIR